MNCLCNFRRYEQFWLPLVAKYGEKVDGMKLIPPLDVGWIWHVHMLAPVKYHEDCVRLIGN